MGRVKSLSCCIGDSFRYFFYHFYCSRLIICLTEFDQPEEDNYGVFIEQHETGTPIEVFHVHASVTLSRERAEADISD
jgi:hypothetical protein